MTRRLHSFVNAAGFGGALSLLVALGACAPAEHPLARVGNESITTDDFNTAARANARQYVAMGDAGKAMLVDELVQRRLMVAAAKQRGFHADTAFLDYVRDNREQFDRELLFRQIAGGNVLVSEPEAHAAWLHRKIEAHALVIFAPDERTAREIMLEMSQGARYEDLARRFNSMGLLANGGDLGFLSPGMLVQPLDDWLATAPVGKVMGPAEATGQGWFLMRVEERRAAEPAPYVQMHDQITALLQQRKQRAWLFRNIDWLKQAYAVHVEPGASATLAARLRSVGGAASAAGARIDTLPPLDPAESAQTLATWSGGVYTLGDAWTALRRPGMQGPNVTMMPMVERWIENQVFDRVMVTESKTRHLGDDPEPSRMLNERLNEYLLNAFYTRVVLGGIRVTPEDLHAEYQQHADAFSALESAEVLTLTLPESLTTEEFAMHVGHAASLREAAAMVGLTSAVRQQVVRFPSDDPLWSALAPRLRMMRAGEYAGPFPIGGGQIIVQLLSKQQHTAGWDQISASTMQQLQTDVLNRKRNERQRAVLDSLRQAIPVSVDTAAVRRLSWPVEALMPGLGTGG